MQGSEVTEHSYGDRSTARSAPKAKPMSLRLSAETKTVCSPTRFFLKFLLRNEFQTVSKQSNPEHRRDEKKEHEKKTDERWGAALGRDRDDHSQPAAKLPAAYGSILRREVNNFE